MPRFSMSFWDGGRRMLDLDTPLYYASNKFKGYHGALTKSIYATAGPGGKFWLDIGRFTEANWFVSRNGEWTTPWQARVVSDFEMPKYAKDFAPTFAEVTDRQACAIGKLIQETDAKVALYYSGGIDSTITLSALIKNLSAKELKNLTVCLSMDSIIENPAFFDRFIKNKFALKDSATTQYTHLIDEGYYAITADQGDCLFGTEAGIQMYFNHGFSEKDWGKRHYSEFADQIVAHFRQAENPDFGRLLYEKIVHNIRTATVPIYSLHDFFWWIIFNVRYLNCALRSSLSYYGGDDRRKSIHSAIINWFNHPDYQRWSMANNNNGEKIRDSLRTYKWAGRKYIYDLDKNDWYFNHKLKIMSLGSIIKRGNFVMDKYTLFGMDTDYNLLRLTQPEVRQYVETCLQRYQVDWL
jgi:hypothetical protein